MRILFLLLMFSLIGLVKLQAQGCSTFECAYQSAERQLNKRNYELALNNLEDAEDLSANDTLKKNKVRALRKKIFEAIEKEKREAVLQRQRADEIALKAQEKFRAAKNLALYFMMHETNPTLAYRILEYNAQRHGDDEATTLNYSKEIVDTTEQLAKFSEVFKSGSGEITSLAFSPDGKQIGIGHSTGAVLLFDLSKDTVILNLSYTNSTVNEIVFSPDGKTMAFSFYKGGVVIWDLDTQKEIAKLDYSQAINSLAFSPDSRKLAIGAFNKNIYVFDFSKQKLINFPTTRDDVKSVAFSTDGKYILTACDNLFSDCIVQIWDANSYEMLNIIDSFPNICYCTAYAKNGDFAFGAIDEKEQFTSSKIVFWAINDAQKVREFYAHEKSINSLFVSPDQKLLFSSSRDGSVKSWALPEGWPSKKFSGHAKDMSCAAISPDGKFLITGGKDSLILFWNLRLDKGNHLYKPISFKNDIEVWMKDTSELAELQFNGRIFPIDTISVFSPETYEEKISVVFSNSAYSSDKLYLAAPDNNGGILLIDKVKNKVIRIFEGFQGEINAIVFSPDNNYILSGGTDGIARIWSIKTGLLLKSFWAEWPIEAINFSDDAKYIIAKISHSAFATADDIIVWKSDRDFVGNGIYSFSNSMLRAAGVQLEPADLLGLYNQGEPLSQFELQLIDKVK